MFFSTRGVRQWTPALLEFVGEVVPAIVAIVLQRPRVGVTCGAVGVGNVVAILADVGMDSSRPELPPAISEFVNNAGPTLAPAVVRHGLDCRHPRSVFPADVGS